MRYPDRAHQGTGYHLQNAERKQMSIRYMKHADVVQAELPSMTDELLVGALGGDTSELVVLCG